MKVFSILISFALVACSSTGVIPMDGGTYMIAKRSAQVGFGPPDGVKADVYREANDFCSKDRKKVETVNLEVTDTSLGRPGNVSLQFRCKYVTDAPTVSTMGTTPQADLASIVSDVGGVRSDIDNPPVRTTSMNLHSYALVVGIEQYRQQLPNANFAARDAQTVTEYLVNVLGYPEENVVTLINDRASNVDLAKYFEKWLPNNVEPDSTVFIYYSGHGAPNPKTGDSYLVPYDGDPSFIDETGYSLYRMYDALGKLHAKEIVVAIDSCFSGAGPRSLVAQGARSIILNLKPMPPNPRKMTVLTASSGAQMSSTYGEKGHGLFTYFLLKGIQDEDVVAPDGSLRLDDLFAYLGPQVKRIARRKYNNEQTPQLIVPPKEH